MGPLPVGSGRPIAAGRAQYQLGIASMGPLPVGSGRLPICMVLHRRSTSFNGAAPGRERKTARAAAIMATAEELQWGRSRSGAEDTGSAGGHARPDLASMGPLPVGSGRLRIEVVDGEGLGRFNGAAPGRERKTRGSVGRRTTAEFLASMGPLPVGSGRPRIRAPSSPGRPASMGPLPVGSGRRGASAALPVPSELQWGRSRSGAEDPGRVREVLGPVRLQWGRSRSGAEDLDGGRDRHGGVAASMGPLPVGSGRPAGPASARCPDRCFNGAAPGRERKTHSPAENPDARSELQWGRSRSGAEDPGSRRSRYGLAAASMGPLPVGSGRRLLTTAEPEEVRLQWGRSRSGAEDANLRGHRADGPLRASMGPLPVGSGRRSLRSPVRPLLAASMGPLPVGSGRPGGRLTHRRPPSCFNGAAPGRERKTGPLPAWTSQGPAQLQWGRSRSGAEDDRPSRRYRAPASFNGAAPGRERKTTTPRTVGVEARQLQWGRSRSGAEDQDIDADGGRPQQQLQWGRSRSGAEDRESRRHGAAPSAASMGPLPVGSGRRAKEVRRLRTRWLQWGRSRSGAEDDAQRRKKGRSSRASMGPLPVGSGRPEGRAVEVGWSVASMGPLPVGSGRPRDARDGASARTVASMGPLPVGSGRPGELLGIAGASIRASMGPLPVGSGRHAGLGMRACGRRSFNGAAPGRERKTSTAAGTAGRGEWLQWGRSRSGAEDASTAREAATGRFNGAAPGRERKTGQYAHGARPVASMGPLPVGSGRPDADESVQMASMGPLPVGSGRRAVPSRSGIALQWGRSRSGAEDHAGLGRRCVLRADASMGPLPVGSGRLEAMQAGRAGWPVASMGPLPVGSGRRPAARTEGIGSDCFNGAAPGRERKTLAWPAYRMSATELQWGRSRSGAEDPEGCRIGPGGARGGFNGAAPGRERKTADLGPLAADQPLQWGRSRSGAEDRGARSAPARGVAASMGPLPVGSGRPANLLNTLNGSRLQWGRSRSGAEDAVDSGHDPRASMGPLPVGSGRREPRWGRRQKLSLQWGRSRSGAEDVCRSRRW